MREQRCLSDEGARLCHKGLAPVGRRNNNRTSHHDEAAIALITFMEENLARSESAVLARKGEQAQSIIVHQVEHRRPGEGRNVVFEGHEKFSRRRRACNWLLQFSHPRPSIWPEPAARDSTG